MRIHPALIIALLLFPTASHACLGGEIFIIPILGTLLILTAVVLHSFALAVNNPRTRAYLSLSTAWLSAPFALWAGAGVLGKTSHSINWKCSFSDSARAQVFAHILFPLSVVVIGIAALRKRYPRFSKHSTLEVWLWSILGLWGTLLMTKVGLETYDWGDKSMNTLPWRALHYGAVAAFALVPVLMPLVAPKEPRFVRIVLMFAAFSGFGIILGLTLRLTA
ncbi:MAG: hypothetical protein AB1700_16630 [Bacillota bacterium]